MINKKTITAVLLLFAFLLNADKIPVQKGMSSTNTATKIHPLQQYFERPVSPAELSRADREVNNKLLVMLIEFQEDDNPASTGNGRFEYAAGDYPLNIGSPPHDQEYYWWIMESVRYYYQAASLGAYNLEFDIYPKHHYTEADSMVAAYQLPQEMAYYNPPGASTSLMISRFEEYFYDVFTRVDEDESVDFSEYGHYMIIHAGADSQHDIMGDSQADIPSFFIRVGDGKEVTVDDGTVISYACNVPETISQDGQYGVPNAVITHEFGHSLGFVDLYSTLTGAPQVGWFDIMDSGGMGDLVFQAGSGEYYNIEGGLPALPSAWHRILVWEDYFREHGLLKDIDELNWGEDIRIDPAEKLFYGGNAPSPRFVKVPLTDKEYLLLENRQVDPDGDGGLSFKGALALTPNEQNKRYRVLLYPTYPPYIENDSPNWEYDLFLPGWQREEEDKILNFGGGIMVWHIDDRVIYEEGEYYDGEFQSNYDMNSVNALHTRRGVKILEGDGFDNIGNYNDSYNITGSAWDPFYRYQPLLDSNGEFQRWSDQGVPGNIVLHNDDEFVHSVEFNGNSSPQLLTNDGDPSLFGFYDISSYSITLDQERYMSFKYGTHVFDEIEILGQYDQLKALSPVGMVHGLPSIASAGANSIDMVQQVGSEWGDFLQYSIDWDKEITQPLTVLDIDSDGDDEFVIISDNLIAYIDEDYISEQTEYPSSFSDAPMYLANHTVYPFEDKLIINDNEYNLAGGKLAASEDFLVCSSEQGLSYFHLDDGLAEESYFFETGSFIYDPVILRDTDNFEFSSYVITELGEIWKVKEEKLEKIFDASDYTSAKPSQLMISELEPDEEKKLIFAAGEKLFAISLQGSLIKGFPVLLEDKPVLAGSYLQSMKLYDTIVFFIQRETGGIMAYDGTGKYRQEYSLKMPEYGIQAQYWFDNVNLSLNWFSISENKDLYHAVMSNIDENPIVYSGYRAGENGTITGKTAGSDVEQTDFNAYAFPNPSKDGYFRVRIEGASDNIKLKLYDIAGNLVRELNTELEDSSYQDIRIETAGLASGVYYAVIKSAGKKLTTAIGVIK